MTNPKTVTEFLESEQDYFAMTIGDIHDYRRLLIVFDLARHSPVLSEKSSAYIYTLENGQDYEDQDKPEDEYREAQDQYYKTISKIEGE